MCIVGADRKRERDGNIRLTSVAREVRGAGPAVAGQAPRAGPAVAGQAKRAGTAVEEIRANKEKTNHTSEDGPKQPWYQPATAAVALDKTKVNGKGQLEAHVNMGICSLFIGAWATEADFKTILRQCTEDIVVVTWKVGALKFRPSKGPAANLTSDVRLAVIKKLFKEAIEKEGWAMRWFNDAHVAIL